MGKESEEIFHLCSENGTLVRLLENVAVGSAEIDERKLTEQALMVEIENIQSPTKQVQDPALYRSFD